MDSSSISVFTLDYPSRIFFKLYTSSDYRFII
nr:MAG TPA: hypothetical protein [Caudoviricetes sp.]